MAEPNLSINPNIKELSSSTVKLNSTDSYMNISSLSEIKQDISINIVDNSLSSNASFSLKIETIISDLLKKDIREYINNNMNYIFQSISSIKHNTDKYNKIYQIRLIEKNKNNFILCIIFNFLENLILNKNIDDINDLIGKINEIEIKEINNDNINDENKKLILEILNAIKSDLKENRIDKAYNCFIKAFIFSDEFKIFFNYFTRKLIYDYIYKNINNNLSAEEPIKIFDLLPEKYKQDKNGNYILVNFKKDIMEMNFEKAHNEIYSKVIPYIFKMDLNIIVYNKNNNDIKTIKYKYKENNSLNLNLIYFETEKYFNIYYSKDFFEKFITFLKIVNQQCKKCNNIMETNNKFRLCNNCLKKIVEQDGNVYSRYLDFIENNEIKLFDKNYKIIITEKLSNFSCVIDNKEIILKELINECGLDINELFSKLKQKICLICQKDINNNSAIKLPCECKFCSKKCFDEYMKEIEKKNDLVNNNGLKVYYPMSGCFCGFQYKLNDFNDLKKELEKYNNKDYLDIIETAIKNNLLSRCVLCKKFFNTVDKFVKLKLKDEKEHLVCKKCCSDNKINLDNDYYNKEIFCLFCNKIHIIKSWNKFEGVSDCIII